MIDHDTTPGAPEAETLRCDVHGYGFQFYWACECGRSGKPTTNGRASAGRDRHRRMHERADRIGGASDV